MFMIPGDARTVLATAISELSVLPVSILPEDICVTDPVFLGQLSDTDVRSKIIPSPASAYLGKTTVRYNQLNLNKAFADIIPAYAGPCTGTLSSILPGLSVALGFYIDPNDFIDIDLSSMTIGSILNIKVEAKSTAVGYRGYFVVRYTRTRPTLNGSIRNPNLYGILDVGRTYRPKPTPVPNRWNAPWVEKDSVDMAVYGTDFTPYRDLLKYSKGTGVIADPGGLSTLMNELFGYSSWNSGWGQSNPVLYKAANVPKARKGFEWVMIQTVTDRTPYQTYPYQGTAYFHFNETEVYPET